jgi:hypothetical protein
MRINADLVRGHPEQVFVLAAGFESWEMFEN